jgi:hypothetical protein
MRTTSNSGQTAYDAAAKLPLLVRRLVLAARGVTNVSFRTEAGVRLAGWDGFCEGTEPNPYVAVGPAGWEFSVQKDGIAAKATDDFNKRTGEPDAGQLTFVYVTGRDCYYPGVNPAARLPAMRGFS